MTNKRQISQTLAFLFFLTLFGTGPRIAKANATPLSNAETVLGDIFSYMTDSNEGTTTFRSLLIPFGGRT